MALETETAVWAPALAIGAVAALLLLDWFWGSHWIRGRRYVTPPFADIARLAGTTEGLDARQGFLREFGERPQPSKIVEGPDGPRELFPISEAEGAAQMAVFRWQRKDPLLLRLARTADTVFDLVEGDDPSGARPRSKADSVSLTMVRVPATARLLARFRGRDPGPRQPCVIVRSHYPDWARALLKDRAAWLGIATAIEPPRAFEQSGRCRTSGLKGEVGGVLASPRDEVGLTCAHTLGEGCRSVKHRARLKEHTLEPDVATIVPWSRCLPAADADGVFAPCDKSAAKLLRGERVVMTPSGRRGRVVEITHGATYSGRVHDFPHAQIRKDLRAFLDIPPFWDLTYSRPGDSGSWIVTGDGQWLGVAVAACGFTRLSYAALAAPVVDYLVAVGAVGNDVTCRTTYPGRG
jgi:hypothetical protein